MSIFSVSLIFICSLDKISGAINFLVPTTGNLTKSSGLNDEYGHETEKSVILQFKFESISILLVFISKWATLHLCIYCKPSKICFPK